MRPPHIATIVDAKYVAFTTFSKSGVRKTTPVWIVSTDDLDGFVSGSNSWKVKRLLSDPRCELQPCDARGKVPDGATLATGTARQGSTHEFDELFRAVQSKYGWTAKVWMPLFSKINKVRRRGDMADTAIVIDFD